MADGDRASNRDRSGVIVLAVGPWGLRTPIEFPGTEGLVGLGVDQANDAGFVWLETFR